MKTVSNKKKICALTTISKTMDWFIVDSMRNLSEHGYSVTLVCDMDQAFIDRNSDYAQCISIPMKRGISIKDLLTIPFKLKKIFRENQFDIVYYTSPNVSLYASLGGKLAGIKHRVYSQCGLRYVSFKGFKRFVFKSVEKLTCIFSTTIRAQSRLNMKFAVKEGLCSENKISVVGIGGTTGVDLSLCDSIDKTEASKQFREKYCIPIDAFVFGYVGRINVDKGITELLEAYAKLQEEYSDMYLILVGMIDDTNPIDSELMKKAVENSHIIFTGNVSPDEVYRHMAMFDVLVHPTYREGFGKVLQEAMGMRLPIITTNVPGPSEVVEDGISGILVNVRDTEDLYEKMAIIYGDVNLRVLLAKNGRERAEKYFDRPIMLNNILLDINKIIKIST